MKMIRWISIVSTFTAPVNLEKTSAHWTLHSQLVWQYRVLSGENLPTKQAFCRLDSRDWFWMRGMSVCQCHLFLRKSPRSYRSFNQVAAVGASYLDVFFSMVFGCTSCYLVLKGINNFRWIPMCISFFCWHWNFELWRWKETTTTTTHLRKKTLADRCHSEQVGRCGTRCRWATEAEGRWEGSDYLAKDVEIRTVTPPHALMPKMMGYGIENASLASFPGG